MCSGAYILSDDDVMVTHVCAQIHELWQQFNNMTPQDLLQQHEYLRMHVLQHPEKVIRQGTNAHALRLSLRSYPKAVSLLHRSSVQFCLYLYFD